MAILKIDMVAEMDDGAVHAVAVDQRDLARWEAAVASDLPNGQYTRLRYLAWSALHRTKRYGGTWEQFNTTDCVEVGDPPKDDEEEAGDGAERLDPGPKDQSAAS